MSKLVLEKVFLEMSYEAPRQTTKKKTIVRNGYVENNHIDTKSRDFICTVFGDQCSDYGYPGFI